jgi:hypothetical protein
MLRSTSHPPEHTVPQTKPFEIGMSLLTTKPGVKVEDALITASEYLTCAAATAYESADNSTKEFRALARAVMHQIEAAQILVEAVVEGMKGNTRSTTQD